MTDCGEKCFVLQDTEYSLSVEIENNQKLEAEIKQLKNTIHNLVSAFNDYECAGPEQEQETTWEVLRDIMHEELFKMEKSNGSIKNKNV